MVTAKFEALALPLMEAAFTLAFWVTNSRADAQDVVQEAYLRAWKGFDGFKGEHFRPWFLAIVRNAAYRAVNERRRHMKVVPIEVAFAASGEEESDIADDAPNAEQLLLREVDTNQVRLALARLSPHHREILVLREIEDASYRDIAEVTGTAIGTVMSRLSRARRELRMALMQLEQEARHHDGT